MIRLKFRLVLLLTLFVVLDGYGQIAVKTNIFMDAFRIPNLAVEVGTSQKTTIEVPFYYNQWKYSEMKQYKLMMIQPELRYWLCDKFNGHFFGIHLMAGVYNTMGIKPLVPLWSDMKTHHYKGDFYGAGLSYGYHYILSRHWSAEATLGFGYAYVNYKKYECKDCPKRIEKSNKNYLGPSKAALNLIYMF